MKLNFKQNEQKTWIPQKTKNKKQNKRREKVIEKLKSKGKLSDKEKEVLNNTISNLYDNPREIRTKKYRGDFGKFGR